ncbi:Transposase (plasmid) [Nostoc flagelliforme CCNUN1]|uniref:Transposase n=8 Tax=Nostoc TaxID=1177 RepID=A0A2K8SJE0_9NOSO|nr:ISL3 family transposase [Nostoc flagelliforme]AUB35023.1 Transposase [Nostoc flagelliforme CCNUN1]AUB35565.1 Transposase [Nostoc flagelliforme CCNUN1]AUB35580.1 Transposase [Nostoc flagelliforme CCNUN1]AUB35594.1 Transposase [Nostoc flagelliforme CCNUN1]AUB37299.1 Transposase [Nostoc flagelliforme CCNUN1]
MKFTVEQILNLPDMKVLDFQEIEGEEIIITIEKSVNYSTCPSCGQNTQSIHQNHWRMIHDLSWSKKPVLLKINRRQFKCHKCKKVFSEKLDFVDKSKGYTKRLATDIVQQVLNSNIHRVAERNGLSDEEVESMLKKQASQILNINLSQVKKLGIDEIALVKGQGNYLAVLVDLDTHKPIEIVQSRRIEDIREVIAGWGFEVLNQIEEVSIDLWSPYKSLVEDLMPNANITADRFHVMKQVNDELDRMRKTEKKAAMSLEDKSEKSRQLEALNKSKYSLIKNEDSLNEKQKSKLNSVLEVSPTLAKMHALKEQFRQIFETTKSWGDSITQLLDWMYDARSYFPKSLGTMVRWFGEIVGYFDGRTTSGTVEGINNKLKLIKRLGYGFRNFSNFRLRSLLNWHFSINSP